MIADHLNAVPLAELWRGNMRESLHFGHAVVMSQDRVVAAWGDPSVKIFPRSSCKMIQALPLVESGAADSFGLTATHLALACASHQGASLHVARAREWLTALDLVDQDLRCGAHEPFDRTERNLLIRNAQSPCQLHNNCSGKHCGFLTYVKHIKAGAEYTEIGHPLQNAILEASHDLSGEVIDTWGIDGCSAPNFAMSLQGLATAMAKFASAKEGRSARQTAMVRLWQAMAQYPVLVAGEGRACTELMQAMGGKVAVKTGAEGVFVAILPEQGLGIAVKALDGQARAAEAAIAALLVRFGGLNPNHPAALRRMKVAQKNWLGKVTGMFCTSPDFMAALA